MSYLSLFQHALKACEAFSNRHNVKSDIFFILSDVFSIDRASYLLRQHEKIQDESLIVRFQEQLSLYKRGYPLAYLLGYQDFGDHRYFCEEGVLIPRPETMVLIEVAIEYIQNVQKKPQFVLECGCGTGIISLECALKFPELQFLAFDIDLRAVELAKKNAKYLNVNNVRFYKADFFDLDFQKYLNNDILLLSNPPYVSTEEWVELDENIRRYEAETAFVSGSLGMDHLNQLFRLSQQFSWQGIFEISFRHADLIKKNYSHLNCKFFKDLEGIERFVSLNF